jgi:lysophospholipase L1-like esterase
MTAARHSRHFLALGDSYTIGEGVPPASRWPVQLVARLRNGGARIDAPQIIAATGWTTDELATGMDKSTLQPPYDMVSVQIGVNNQYRGRTTEDYRAQIISMLDRAIELAGGKPGHVLLVSIPDWGVTPFAREQGRDGRQIAAELDAYNAIACAQARDLGARFIDITAISREHPTLLTDDGLHPSAAQYARWVDAIMPTAQTMFGEPENR